MLKSWLRGLVEPRKSRRPRRPFTLRTERLEDRATPSAALLKDINPRTGPGLPPFLPAAAAELNQRLYFFASDGAHDRELWVTDGTAAGTALVKDVNPGPLAGPTWHSGGAGLVRLGNQLVFAATDGVHGQQLWTSDGTAAGTKPIDGPGLIGVDNLTAFAGKVYFTAADATRGVELWATDGTAAGTKLVKDVNTAALFDGGTAGSFPANLTVAGGKLYFSATDGARGTALWATDGTTAGTKLAADLAADGPGSYPNFLTAAGGKLYFVANGGTLYVADAAAPSGARSLPTGELYAVHQLAVLGNALYFVGYDPTSGPQLWTTDGTSAGTRRVAAARIDRIDIQNLTAAGGRLYFATTASHDGVYSRELWATDGTAAGTGAVVSFPEPPHGGEYVAIGGLRAVGDALYFSANGTLYRTDGTAAGTTPVRQFDHAGDPWPGQPQTEVLGKLGATVYLAADDGDHGRELWKTDGTTAGTTLVKDINAATVDSGPSAAVVVGNTAYFTASDPAHGLALWKTDGTAAGTTLVADVRPGPDPAFPVWVMASPAIWPGPFLSPAVGQLTNLGGTLYFVGDDGVSGPQLWKTDGTAAGTEMVTGAGEPTGAAAMMNLTAVGGRLFWSSRDAGGDGLWASDGTAAGTTRLHDFPASGYYGVATGPASPPYFGGIPPGNFTAVGSALYFTADDGEHGQELWVSDGTAAGTKLVADINQLTDSYSYPAPADAHAVPRGSNPSALTALNGKLYFRADDGAFGSELWVTDGTAAGTRMVADINPGLSGGLDILGPGATWPQLLAAGGKLYFNADDGARGQELWVSDGTAAGTKLVKNIRPDDALGYPGGPLVNGSLIQSLTAVGGAVYFAADDGAHGLELWVTDGTAAGTKLVADIAPGEAAYWPGNPAPSLPANLTAAGGRLYFSATDGSGFQVWVSDGTAAGTRPLTDLPDGSGAFPWAGPGVAGLTPAGGWLFAAINDGSHGLEPWAVPLAAGTPPAVVVGADSYVVEGGTLQLTAGVPGRTDNWALKFAWDIDNDGQFDDATGSNPSLVGGQLRNLGLTGGPAAYTIRVRVTDAAGREVGIGSAAVTVKDAPLVLTGTASDAAEGRNFNRNLATFRDVGGPEAVGRYRATITWADGTSSPGTITRDGGQFRVSGAHAYRKAGVYQVTIAISEDGGPAQTVTSTITVADAGIHGTRSYLRTTEGRPVTGAVASFTDRNALGSIADFAATIAWGDGTTSAGTIVANPKGGYDVLGTHTYAKAGTYAVQVQIKDGVVTTTISSTAKVDAVVITARGLTAVGVANKDVAYTVAAFRDSDRRATAALFTATIDWADGTTSAGTIESDGAGGFRVTGKHRYAAAGLRSVKVTIRDTGGRTATTTGTARVLAA